MASAWAEAARNDAEQKLAALPALTGEEEEWRFTEPAALGLDGGDVAAPGASGAAGALGEGGRAARLALVDGAAGTVDAQGLPDGVIVTELGEALASHEDLVRPHLGSLVGTDTRPGALNAARWDAGLFVYVPRGAAVELPIEALLTATGAAGRVYGRTLVVLEEGAKATVIDRCLSPDLGGTVQASTVTELVVGPGAELEHITIIGWGSGVHHHATLAASAAKDSRVRSVVVSLGGDVVRVEPTMFCRGQGADARALGLFFADGDQHFEHRVVSRHEAPAAYSNLLYKGALKDTARTVFFGNLVVPPGAPGTDAYQTNRNLVLNEGASAETIPFLEIETAEVKCSHAGAVGRVDDEHLFYLRSRGVPEAEAKQLVVLGFLQEVLEEVRLEELRHELEAAVARKLGVQA
ncbi:MAG: Fe-S cluster assembly protein SufD [Thermoleophilia bacterium]|nr:Fe-S cluster assembly protein SufD [Thermoleophilia bacterium]